MSRILTVDIGAGTMDVLYYDTGTGVQYKAVVKSPVASVAEKASHIDGNLLIVGSEMGGGPLSSVLKKHAAGSEVVMSESAAATVHHSLDKVRSFGIQVVEDQEAEKMQRSSKYTTLMSCDVEVDRLKDIIKGFGVPMLFDIVGFCAQDHGVPPEGVSHLDCRHNHFKEKLDKDPFPHTLLYRNEEVPKNMNRLRSIAKRAEKFHADEIYVMDSGMAAILGASMDQRVINLKRSIVMDIATSHTVGAALENGELCGFFEYHTKDISVERLETLLRELADGKLEHRQILSEGGHGAYTRKCFGFDNADALVATGPKRKLLKSSGLPILLGAPLGDNMMTGTVGILEAIRKRKGFEPISYV